MVALKKNCTKSLCIQTSCGLNYKGPFCHIYRKRVVFRPRFRFKLHKNKKKGDNVSYSEPISDAPSASNNICRHHIAKILLRQYIVQVSKVLIHIRS